MKILVTGTAGFIGFHLVKKLINKGHEVIGIDNINNYYSTDLKYDRLKECGVYKEYFKTNRAIQSLTWPSYHFLKLDIVDTERIMDLFKDQKFDLVIHLAAQAGVRYSMENPQSYIQSNIVGFFNVLEACRHFKVKRLFYASSSSIYGLSDKALLSISDMVDHPVSLYAATKKSNELMAHSYSHLYDIQTVGLRFFTVYGPWGRPDMAPFLFVDAILKQKPIQVFNQGNLQRDFTYIEDIVESINTMVSSDLNQNYNIFNLGNNSPIILMDFIKYLENELGIIAKKKMVGMQPGDVLSTWADTTELIKAIGYKPKTNIKEGVREFVHWYKEYYKVDN